MPRSRLTCALALLLLCSSIPAQQLTTTPSSAPVLQTAPVRDPKAVAVLGQAVAVAGGASALSAIQDYTAFGQITYFWAGKEVTGPVTLRGRAPDQFRLDANLPEGIRSWCVSDRQGQVKDTDGKTTLIPFSNATNLGVMSFPHLALSLALNDVMASVTSTGTSTLNGRQILTIRTQEHFSAKTDPHGQLAAWSTKDYIFDAATQALLETRDSAFSISDPRMAATHEAIFSDFRTISSTLVPFSISEKIGGQQTWTIQLSSINFNTGLSNSDFHF